LARGFTLVELIVVMSVVAIVASVGFTRLTDDTAIKGRRFGTDAAALIGAAQRLAMAQRRTIYLSLNAAGGTVSLCLDAGCASTIAPAPDQSGVLSVPSGIAFTTSASTMSFDSRGRAVLASSLALRVTTAAGADLQMVVNVEPDTGHVQLVIG
jgi:MSHA pilin protein MshC